MRKFILLLLVVSCTGIVAYSQYWQQEVNYRIDVTLNDQEHSLNGFAKIDYTNNSPDTLGFIWFHIWPNAYKHDQTAFSDQHLENGNTKFYFSNKDQRGYINRLDFKVNNAIAEIADHPQHIDIVKVILPEPLAPGQKAVITTAFHVKLPFNFSRGGHDGQSYQATQWYPKPAVYDKNGWHPMPYLDQGEFYSEFGNFDVRITVPMNYVVAATGELQDDSEKEWLLKKQQESIDLENQVIKLLPPNVNTKSESKKIPPSAKETKTVRFVQDNVHDFAWFADKRFLVKTDTLQLPSGRVIMVNAFYEKMYANVWKNSVKFTKDAIRFYSDNVGEYPYNVVSVVQGPESFGGGMEYPTITVISPGGGFKEVDRVITHEVGHNWFYGILGNNEREHPWLDEGLNSYYEDKYMAAKYGQQAQLERLLFETTAIQKTDQPIATASSEFSQTNYVLSSYYKTAAWLRYVETQIGIDTFNRAMQEYFHRWQFKHPSPGDFRKVLEDVSGKDLGNMFAYIDQKGLIPAVPRKGTQFIFLFSSKKISRYTKDPSKNVVIFGPALGLNSYDKLMLGALVTNVKLPPSKFQFFLAPLYGTGSKNLGGIGVTRYSFYTDGIFRKIDLGLNGAAFTIDEFQPDSGAKVYMSFHKIVPSIRFTFREKAPRSTFHKYIQFKTFLIAEDRLRFFRDSIFNPPDTTVVERFGTEKENRVLNQLDFVIENTRVLYPYRGELRVEQANGFVRTAFTGKYFFNYPKEGGLQLRLFAGKFFYTGSKTILKQFETDRYHLNLTGANGYEDYTYSDYFIGRNKFEGFASQQIMVRDGAFKVRTDLLADKVGRTDDWLLATNLTTSVPSGLNPLSMLPIKIPLKLFLDIGTHAEAWERDAVGDRFLYDFGLQLSFFKETVNIYFPLLYSRVFKDYIQSTIEKKGRFWKTISFSIDISNFSLRKIDRNLDF